MNQHPFDVSSFIKENKQTIKKYIRKNTYSVYVEDMGLDKEYYYQNDPKLLNDRREKPELTFMQKLEYIKCMKNCNYFTQKYIKIVSIDEGIIPFKLYDYQKELLSKYENNRFCITLQARQSGKTITTAAYILWFNTFNQSKTTAILANKAAQAREILSRIQLSYESLPNFLKQGVSEYNKGSMAFSNHSEIFCAATTSSSIRGRSISLLYIDEAAFIRNDMEFYESTYPTISSGKHSRVIISSTPNGCRGLFYKLWTEAEEQLNHYVTHKVTWDMVPGRDEQWMKEQIANTSQEQFDQEHRIRFKGSQNSLLSGQTLEQLVERKPIEVKDHLKVYSQPVEGHIYMMTVDVSRGVGRDYSAFVVYDVTELPYEVVATYRNNKISSLLYPTPIYSTATYYNNAMVLVEINDIGEQVVNILFEEYEYEELLMTKTEKNRQVLWFGGGQTKHGVRTTTPVKSIGCSSAKSLIENNKLTLNDPTIIQEFGTFIPKGKSYEADSGAHDDLVMCCVIFGWATTQDYFKQITDINTRAEILKEREDREDLMPFGIIDSNIDDEHPAGYTGITEGTVTTDSFFDGF